MCVLLGNTHFVGYLCVCVLLGVGWVRAKNETRNLKDVLIR